MCFLRFRGLGQSPATLGSDQNPPLAGRYFWKFAAMEGSQRTEDRSQRTEDRSPTFDLRLPTSVFCILLLLLSLSSGCGNKFFDPTQVGRFRPVPAVNIILESLGVAEEPPVAWEDAEEPLAIDTVAMESDYAFMAGDIISVAIFELLQEGVQFVNNYIVTETGRVSIPEVGVVKATITDGFFNILGERICLICSSSCVSVNPATSITPTSGMDILPVSVTT